MLLLEHSRLPLELYRPIVEAVYDRAALLQLTATCSLLRVEAERVLYSTVELDPEHDPRFCEFFARYAARIARHVRKCSLFLPGACATREHFEKAARRHPYSGSAQAGATCIASCIPLMRNLRTLSVNGHVTSGKFGSVLRSSRLSLSSFASSAPLDRTTLEFLESQTHITELTTLHSRLSSGLPGRRLAAHALPNLAVVRALTPRIVCELAPRRPVTHVETYVWGGASCARVAGRLARARGPGVRALLVIQGFKLRARDVAEFARALPALAFLGECHFVDPMPVCVAALSKLTALRTLVLSPALGVEDDRVALVALLARACPALRTIVFTIALMPRQVWVRNACNGRWEQARRPAQSLCCTLWAAT